MRKLDVVKEDRDGVSKIVRVYPYMKIDKVKNKKKYKLIIIMTGKGTAEDNVSNIVKDSDRDRDWNWEK